VLAGDGQTPFTVHKNVIRKFSEYFNRAFGPNYQEGEDGVMNLPEVSASTFAIYQKWMYLQVTRDFLPEVQVPQSDGLKREYWDHYRSRLAHDEELLWGRLLELYILADAYETTALRNDILSTLQMLSDRAGLWPGFRIVPSAFERLSASSTFCQYLIKSAAMNWNGTDSDPEVAETIPSLPKVFAIAVMKINTCRAYWDDSKMTERLQKDLVERCTFHEHASEEEKATCKERKNTDMSIIESILEICLANTEETVTEDA
jgi:hypothetical protein